MKVRPPLPNKSAVDADPSARVFAGHLNAQLESAPAKTDDERGRAIAIAKERTEAATGRVLGVDEVRALVATAQAIGLEARERFGTRVDEKDYAAVRRVLDVDAGLRALRGVVAQVGKVNAQLAALVAVEPTAAQKSKLDALLDAPAVDPDALVRFVGDDLGAGDMLREWMGTKEGTSLGTHTAEVLASYAAARPGYAQDVVVPKGVRLERTLRWTMTLHDIGKSAALESGDKAAQHAFTVPVVVALSKKLGFADAEIALMRALVDNDAIGEALNPAKGRDLDDAARELRLLAKETGTTPADFFALQNLFWVSDAGAYRFLRERIFTVDESGVLRSTDPKLDELQRRVAR